MPHGPRQPGNCGEYDKTFEIETAGTVRSSTPPGTVLISGATLMNRGASPAETKDVPIRNWIKNSPSRCAPAPQAPGSVLARQRPAPGNQPIAKVNDCLPSLDADGFDDRIMAPTGDHLSGAHPSRRGRDRFAGGVAAPTLLTDLFDPGTGTSAR